MIGKEGQLPQALICLQAVTAIDPCLVDTLGGQFGQTSTYFEDTGSHILSGCVSNWEKHGESFPSMLTRKEKKKDKNKIMETERYFLKL